MNLVEQTSSIRSRGEFLSFLTALRNDLSANPESWQNVTLESFLEALQAWVNDMDGYYTNIGKPVPQVPDWQVVAEMLMASRVYE